MSAAEGLDLCVEEAEVILHERCPECGEEVEVEIEEGLGGDPDRAWVSWQACECAIFEEWAGEVLSETNLEDLYFSEMGWI